MEDTSKIKNNNILFIKIFFGYIIASLAILILMLFTVTNSNSFISLARQSEKTVIPYTFKAKDLQLHIIQVQQWLTDISATRGAEGYDDGFDEAESHANSVREILNDFYDLYKQRNLTEQVNEINEIQVDFEDFYKMGQQMANTYIEFGPDKGNEFMEKFDPYAEELNEHVGKFINEQLSYLNENLSGISGKSVWLKNFVIFASCVDFLIILSIGFFLALQITKPIKKFANMLKDISEGEGDLTHKINIKSKDEIGNMALYFNKTFEKIRELVATVQQQSDNLNNVGAELASNMTETASAINEISANIQSIKNQTINQSASVTETSTTMEHISGGIENLNKLIGEQTANISESSNAINELIINIDKVASTLVQNGQNIGRLSESSESGRLALEKITNAIREVSEESKGLLEISTVISAIAEETNLLAMNAAIEAAHAGDSGKGFAVVADEVRKLAESSAEQTMNIETKLVKITDSINLVMGYADEVVEKFNSIATEVNTVAQQEEAIRTNMENQSQNGLHIRESMNILNNIAEKVSQSSVQMLEGSNQVTNEARNMTAITEEINGGMNEMASGAEQINKAVNIVNTLTLENKNSIDSLISEVKKFKV